MDTLLKAKTDQTVDILKKNNIDLWMIMTRESSSNPDPCIPMVVGADVVWTSFFLFSSDGRKIALVGNFDVPLFERLGHFTDVIGYTKGVREDLINTLEKLRPRKIAINYSLDQHVADGLSYGLYLQLMNMLKGTLFEGMVVSAEAIVSELRALKLPEEVERVRKACNITERLYGSLVRKVRDGINGTEVYEFLKKKAASKGVGLSFPPTISIGTKTPLGHGVYSDDMLEKGEIFHIDFGVVYKGFCSDLQRLIYILRDGEDAPPPEVQKAFNTVSDIIKRTAKEARPGVNGYSLDRIARDILRDNEYPEYQHALGHQLGRFVHDGGTILGPRWERYGKNPFGKLEEGNIFTLELEIILKGIGVVALEEDIVITPKGGKFLSKFQRRLTCV